jgi:hypothetical protein
VSIKNKLVTAITTAGLLAGLFGSAFVPVARAATTAAALTCAADTDWDDINAPGGTAPNAKATCTAKAGKSVKLTITTTGAGDNVKVVVSGATVDTNVLALDADHSIVQITSTTITLSANITGGATTFAVTAPAAGGTATVKSYFADSTTLNSTITIKSVAAAVAGIPSAYTSNTALQTTDFDSLETLGATITDGVAGSTTVNGGVDYIAADYASDVAGAAAGLYNVQMVMADAYDELVLDKNFTVSTSCGTVDAAADADDADQASDDAEVITPSDAATGDLFISVQHPGVDEPCLATVTVKYTATGKVIHTFKVGFLGETATVTITGPSALAAELADNNDLGDQIAVVAKDAKGIVIPSRINAVVFTAAGVDEFNNATEPDTTTMVDTDAAGGTLDDQAYDLTELLCPADSEGTKVTLYAEGEEKDDETNARSNTITITCTGSTAYISKVAFDKGRGLASEVLDVVFTLVDGDGRAMGVGGGMADDTNYAIINTCSTTVEPASLLALEVGVAEYEWTASNAAEGTCGFTFNVVDNDDAALDQAAIFTPSIFIGAASYENSISKVARKVTVDFGPGAASRKVTFTVEFLSGRIRNYVRKSNAAGIANFTSPFGRVYVTASFGDEISDTVYLKK